MAERLSPSAPAVPAVGAWVDGDGVRFRVWAPGAASVSVEVDDASHQLAADGEHGHWVGHVDGIEVGARYRYRLDGGDALPDPASMSQPDGVHGASAVVEPSFAWTDADFVAPTFVDSVFYELHVGTFTAEGTFDAVIPHLDRLAELGVTTVELLPVSQFPGGRNWGYDGVFPFAAQDTYGGLEGLHRLVDAAHARGLAICLDVVHNHLGPEGNVLGRYGPYFTDRYRTPWGEALNFDGPGSDQVRELFLESARFFVEHAHVDAFRLDAVHAIVDASAYPYVEELGWTLREAARQAGRQVVVVAESADDQPLLTAPVEEGGWGLDGQWNDDFHHALHVALTGERDGYYQDYDGAGDLARAFLHGFTFHGQASPSRGHRHGHPRRETRADRQVVFSANHDQVGNRLAGDRLTAQVDTERAKVAAAVVLLSPSVPMLFMGDEHADAAPFPYFVSHTDPELIEAVRVGRAEEFAAFSKGRTPPDPQAEETFRSAVLDHEAARTGAHEVRWRFHQELLRLRRELLTGRQRDLGAGALDRRVSQLAAVWHEPDALALLVLFDDAPSDQRVTLSLPGDGNEERWEPAFDTADPTWGGPGCTIPEGEDGRRWSMAGPSALLLVRTST